MSLVSAPRLRSRSARLVFAAAVAAAAVIAGGGTASAHTEGDYAAVPAGEQMTVHISPTHGCSGSPTTAVSVRVPAPDATPGEVEGFTATAEPDGDRTVLRWSGGLVPADEHGSFPVTFTVPDQVGELLLFPTVQTCEVGEVAWIDGDPDGEHPAVRMLVLAAGSQPAATIDDVPADAPGRDQLTAIVDVDNPSATPAPDATTPATEAPGATATPDSTTTPATSAPDVTVADTTAPADATTAPAGDATTTTVADDDDGSGAATAVFVGVIVVVLLGAGAGYLIVRRKR